MKSPDLRALILHVGPTRFGRDFENLVKTVQGNATPSPEQEAACDLVHAAELVARILASAKTDAGVKRWWQGRVRCAYATLLGYEGDVGGCRALADALDAFSDTPHGASSIVISYVSAFFPKQGRRLRTAQLDELARIWTRGAGRPKRSKAKSDTSKWIALHDVAKRAGFQVSEPGAVKKACERRTADRRRRK